MKKTRNEKLTLHRETLRILVGGVAVDGGSGFVTPPTASEQDDCSTTNAMVSACIC